MNYETLLTREKHLKKLIEQESTGTPEQLASKLNTSVSAIYRLIRTLKKLGEEIGYSKIKQTYYYKKLTK
ncbi:HTH domain-containing protein [Marinifilum caeruleilacunae]|uniref:HTH domain-containing protein n=1 Tax=Marinifilum caeruleilacunae TaxID=2499076 RepID=A0ABX1WZP1_9BACT|nr:HTH domain-containing protein [Marinifilum caeruleilacunae]NOU61601.1 HTH domain-containing protein [Marinifilum caeruleilacunae]